LDFKWVWFPIVVLNGLRNLIKEPLLGSNILSPSLEPNIISTVTFNQSLHWKSWSDIERSINVESKFLIKAFSLCLFSLIKIKHSPLLVVLSSVICNSNSLTFLVLWSSYIKNLVICPVNELTLFKFEDLEPSRVSAPDLHVVGFTSTLDVPRLVV
jgi:hypothetical protein